MLGGIGSMSLPTMCQTTIDMGESAGVMEVGLETVHLRKVAFLLFLCKTHAMPVLPQWAANAYLSVNARKLDAALHLM